MDIVAGLLIIVAATKVKGMRSSRKAYNSKLIDEIPIDFFDEVYFTAHLEGSRASCLTD